MVFVAFMCILCSITWILFVWLLPFQFNGTKKSISFIGKRFCHAHIDFIAKSEQILRLFRVSFSL